MNQATGWAREKEDLAFLTRFCAKSFPKAFRSVEVKRNLRYDWLDPENQGDLGSCQGQAIKRCVQVLYFIATGKILDFSALWAYLRTQKEDGLLGADNGSTIAGGVNVAKLIGMLLAKLVPYVAEYPSQKRIKEILSAENDQAAEPYRILSGVPIKSFDDALQWLSGGGVISIGTVWPFRFGPGWIVDRWEPQGNGGHARMLAEITDGRLTELNSWGPDWGDHGRFHWDRKPFEDMLRHPWSVVIGLSDMAKPQPRKIDFNAEVWKK